MTTTDINITQLQGRLGEEPKIFETKDGGKIARLRIATSETYATKDGEVKEVTQWHDAVTFNKLVVATIEEHLKKGSRVNIQGATRHRSYEKKDGSKGYNTEVVFELLHVLS